MYELLLNAAKVLVSKDARDAGKSLLNIVQNSPEWQNDICTLTLRIDSNNRERNTLIRELTAKKLTALDYPDSAIDAFRQVYGELVTNAFDHGLVNRWIHKGIIAIEVEINNVYVRLVVRNTKGVRFDLEKTLEEQRTLLTANPRTPRGRGLLTVSEMTDELSSLENGRAIKAVLWQDRVAIDYFQLENLVVFSVVSGTRNPSLLSRLERHALRHEGFDVIFHFPHFSCIDGDTRRSCSRESNLTTMVLSLRERLEQLNRKLVVIGVSQRNRRGQRT